VNGQRIAADAIVWATGAGAPPRLSETGLALDTAGFIAVNEHLQSISSPAVFAAGDCAMIGGYAYPKSGVYAVRQGPPLAANLRRSLAGAPLIAYRPQRRALALISTGDKYAVASYGPLAFESAWVWRWKDYIDRRFMAKYNVPA
jgi:selenide,water dikinase